MPKNKGVAAVLLVTSGRLRPCVTQSFQFSLLFVGAFLCLMGRASLDLGLTPGAAHSLVFTQKIVSGCLMNVLNRDTRFLNRLFAVFATATRCEREICNGDGLQYVPEG